MPTSVAESGVESGNNSDSETGNDSANAGHSEGSDRPSQMHSNASDCPTATFGEETPLVEIQGFFRPIELWIMRIFIFIHSVDIDSDRCSSSLATMLPWGARKETYLQYHVDIDVRPGEFVMRSLFTEFCQQAERKIESVLCEPPVSAGRISIIQCDSNCSILTICSHAGEAPVEIAPTR